MSNVEKGAWMQFEEQLAQILGELGSGYFTMAPAAGTPYCQAFQKDRRFWVELQSNAYIEDYDPESAWTSQQLEDLYIAMWNPPSDSPESVDAAGEGAPNHWRELGSTLTEADPRDVARAIVEVYRDIRGVIHPNELVIESPRHTA